MPKSRIKKAKIVMLEIDILTYWCIDNRVASLTKKYLAATGIILENSKSLGQF